MNRDQNMRDEILTFPHSHCQECQSRNDSRTGLGIGSICLFAKLEAENLSLIQECQEAEARLGPKSGHGG